MNQSIQESFCLIVVSFLAASSLAKDLAWQTAGAGVRSARLEIPASGKTGFTLLSPDQTGITFTNSLDERAGAANRVLFNGSGVAVGDYDNDSRPDIYFCSLNGRNTLYRNLGGWRFADVTEQAGLKRDPRFYRGAVFADVNGDGAPDLLVSVVGGGVELFLNDGRGKFSDATTASRLASRAGSMTMALADVDGNGTLDLYVANNRSEDIRDRGQVTLRLVNGKMVVPPSLRNRLVVMNGQVLEYGEPDQLYLNDGKGRFAPISWTGGRFRNEDGGPVRQPPLDWGLTATFRDINGDGFPDLYVCNDFWTPDHVWLNDGRGRFRLIPRLALRNMCASSMCVDLADIDRDGRLDIFVLDMLSRDLRLRKRQKLAQPPMASPIGAIDDRPQFMRNTLQWNRGDSTYAEIANYAGVAASDWSWSTAFIDVDLDGYPDLLIPTGHAKDVQDLDAAEQIRARQHSWSGFASEAERQKAFTQELMEHMRLYPELHTPIVAFRNRGDLTFEEVTARWGTAQPGIHHAIALADFDGDGDLDFVVNNFGSAAGVYRNDATAARVAVRLRGKTPNTEGVGARVILRNGAVPLQSQEVICGGRYLSGSEPLVVFAVGKVTGGMTLEVVWRSGKRCAVAKVQPNHLYEIDERTVPALPDAKIEPRAAKRPLFTDVSALLQHTHHEELFDDFERQPLLPRRLSQLGPGVSWFDVDGDGHEDLIIGSGRGGRMAVYRNTGRGGFERWTGGAFDMVQARDQTTILGSRSRRGETRLLAGAANYEDGRAEGASVLEFDVARKTVDNSFPGAAASTGPLALADMDGDGDLDLFVGGRVIPGRYPEAASSRLFRFDGTHFEMDAANSNALANVGLVSAAIWSDLNGDGFPELILACEWGPIRIFRNDHGRITPWESKVTLPGSSTVNPQLSTLSQLTGWWNGISTGDLDGDGRLDIVAANWGLNSEYVATRGRPVQLYYGDLLDRGVVDLIETEWDPAGNFFAPRRRLDVMAAAVPGMRERFGSHRSYSQASISEVLGPGAARMRQVEATTLTSMVFFNRGDHLEAMPLPREAQWAPAFGVCVADFDGDGNEDVFLSQNFFAVAPEIPRLDAGRGLLLRSDGRGNFESISGQDSGIEVYGEQRGSAVADFDEDGRADLVVSQNGAETKLFRNIGGRPGLRIRVIGPKENPDGVGAVLRLKSASGFGPAREIHAGSGYWSEDAAIQIMNRPGTPTHLWVRWPGGASSTVAVPPNATQMSISITGGASTP